MVNKHWLCHMPHSAGSCCLQDVPHLTPERALQLGLCTAADNVNTTVGLVQACTTALRIPAVQCPPEATDPVDVRITCLCLDHGLMRGAQSLLVAQCHLLDGSCLGVHLHEHLADHAQQSWPVLAPRAYSPAWAVCLTAGCMVVTFMCMGHVMQAWLEALLLADCTC